MNTDGEAISHLPKTEASQSQSHGIGTTSPNEISVDPSTSDEPNNEIYGVASDSSMDETAEAEASAAAVEEKTPEEALSAYYSLLEKATRRTNRERKNKPSTSMKIYFDEISRHYTRFLTQASLGEKHRYDSILSQGMNPTMTYFGAVFTQTMNANLAFMEQARCNPRTKCALIKYLELIKLARTVYFEQQHIFEVELVDTMQRLQARMNAAEMKKKKTERPASMQYSGPSTSVLDQGVAKRRAKKIKLEPEIEYFQRQQQYEDTKRFQDYLMAQQQQYENSKRFHDYLMAQQQLNSSVPAAPID